MWRWRIVQRLGLSFAIALAVAVPLVACGWNPREFDDLPLWLFVALSIDEAK